MANYGVTDVEYTVVTGLAADTDDFIGKVETLLSEGWVCKGGVSAIGSGSTAELLQAMTKDTDMRVSEYRTKHGHGPRDGGRRKTRSKTRRNRGRRN